MNHLLRKSLFSTFIGFLLIPGIVVAMPHPAPVQAMEMPVVALPDLSLSPNVIMTNVLAAPDRQPTVPQDPPPPLDPNFCFARLNYDVRMNYTGCTVTYDGRIVDYTPIELTESGCRTFCQSVRRNP
ncbi:MAG: hypothetical protein HOO67_02200 [Candidatus Peribacteraceae bacterium]|nr:hypothetical protein [Candidatus Peribacteraceae bacterium]